MSPTIFRDLFRISLPLMIGTFLQTLYGLTDIFFLGKLGKAEVSAASIATPANLFLIFFAVGLSSAGTTLISQSKGKGEQGKIDFYLGQTTFVLLGVGVLLMLVGLIGAKYLLILLQTPEEVFPFAFEYMTLFFLGIPSIFGGFVIMGSMQGIGDTKTPLKLEVVTNIINVILDPILIFGLWGCPALGVKGAAIATVIARGMLAVIGFILLIRGKHGLTLKRKHLIPDTKGILLLFRIGLPPALGQSFGSLGTIVLQGLINSFGAGVIAAAGVGNSVMKIFFLPSMAISSGAAVLIGQSLGAKDYTRLTQIISVSIKSTLGILVIPMAAIFFWGDGIARFFIHDPETIAHSVMFFRFASISTIFFALFNVVSGVLQGAGDTKPLMCLQLLKLWGIRLPVAYFLVKFLLLGPSGIWASMVAANLICFLVGLFRLQGESWKMAIDVDAL